MAYFEQVIMSATPGGTTGNNDIITIVNGSIADSFINKAVTYDGAPTDLANPKVKLAGAGDIVIGSILGVSHGKLQIAVGGWDIKFYSSVQTALPMGSRIIGAALVSGAKGYVNAVGVAGSTYDDDEANNIRKSRGAVYHGGTIGTPAPAAGSVLVRVTLTFGG